MVGEQKGQEVCLDQTAKCIQMSSHIPTEWQYDPPGSLVVGDGSYASVLAFVLGTVALPFEQLRKGPAPNDTGGYPRVFDDLKWSFLVVMETMAPAEALRCHSEVWDWVEKLSSEKEQHELAFVFVLPPGTPQSYEAALAAGLILPAIDPLTSGHAVWTQSGSLGELIVLAGSTPPSDVVRLRGRRASDSRHIALTRLIDAARGNDPAQGREAAMEVLASFSGQEYDLDLFCRPPFHQNGNLLRDWLDTAVTTIVTPESWVEQRRKLAVWLPSNSGETK
jgi:hypothetical protein